MVVLIDEIDRMQSEELTAVLKVLRGASTIPNVSFVCAFSEKRVREVLAEDHDYLEKFFPVSVGLSAPSTELIGRLFQARLSKAFADQQWFDRTEDKEKFEKLLQDVWQDALRDLCTNFRQAGLLLNDVFTAARPIVREVNPFDLVLIECLRRFYPQVYTLVKANRPYLTPGGTSWAKYEYLSSEDKSKGTKEFAREVEEAIKRAVKPDPAKLLLRWLFPLYENAVDSSRKYRAYVRPTNEDISEVEKRICDADHFVTYFRGAVPEEMFSNAELERVISDLNAAGSEAEVEGLYRGVLDSLPKGYPKREDFLWKLSRASDRIADAASERLAYAAARRASDYTYSFMSADEAARALNLVFRAAQKLSATASAQRVLEGAMARASDDTFALRILEFTEFKDRNKILTDFSNINAVAVRAAFVARMRRRYGAVEDIEDVDITRSDWQALRLWAANSAEDRDIEQAFWRRFIGGSRKRLAQAANFAFPSGLAWTGGYPAEPVSGVFPTDEFRRLLREIPNQGLLDEVETKALARMQRLVDGTWEGEGGLNVS